MFPNRYPNKLKQVLEDGRVAFGAATQIPAPALVEILGLVGYDFTMIDTEHGLFDMQGAGDLVRTALGANLTPLVRVLKNDTGLIMKALDLGAQGVIVPHISNKGDAEKAVEAAKYRGVRGACPLVRSAGFGLWEWPQVQEEADRDTFVIPIIEDLRGVENLEMILDVPGIDIVFMGPFDMSVSAGFQGNVAHPEILGAMEKILEACRKRKVPVMHTLTGGTNVDAWVERGVRLVMQSADSVVFARAQRAFLESVSHLREKKLTTPVREEENGQ
jgi:4-hydroxy-2-oxoheptanedioate aldolase